MKEQTCDATVFCSVSQSFNKFAKRNKKRDKDKLNSVRMDKLSSWQVNEGTVFADRYLLFSGEGIKQQ